MNKLVVMSLGGSVIFPGRIDVKFLRDFKKIIEKLARKGYKFVIYCGGGKIAREYQKAASEIAKLSQENLDWIGIYATELNAQFVKKLFGGIAEDIVITNPKIRIKMNKKVLIAAGWKPGWSTDYDAVLLAKNFKVDTVINMSNIDYVYDKDPKKHAGAKKIKNIPWKEYRKISGKKWKAGLNMPFDPVAAKEAEKSGLTVFIIGKDLRNFENLINKKGFKGTVIG
ncbi:UMP kinase [Candidatus Woesearchaeota archaeon]|nr:UMP kinase [Candidatus Woesearchaeota archaeon]